MTTAYAKVPSKNKRGHCIFTFYVLQKGMANDAKTATNIKMYFLPNILYEKEFQFLPHFQPIIVPININIAGNKPTANAAASSVPTGSLVLTVSTLCTSAVPM